MRQRFDDILTECIRQLEASGGDVETVLSRYPERAAELRPYLEVWTSLAAVERAQASSAGAMRGRQQLLTAMARAEQPQRGVSLINSPATKGGLSMRFAGMKFAGMFVAGAVLALGITFLTGNMGFGGDSPTAAAVSAECIAALDFNDDGALTVEDMDELGEVINGDSAHKHFDDMDVNNDHDVDIEDVVEIIGEVVGCFQGPQP